MIMANPNCEQESIAEVTVIDSQFQHFSSYIDVIRVFKCRLCTFCSPLEHVIASHMSEVHFPRRNYLCKQCLFVFEDRDQLTNHLESAHGTKSINVCFGDTPNYTSPPPSWRSTRSEEDGMSRLTVGDERGLDEGRNGRVTSSTGNLANIRDDVHDSPNQTERMEHSGSTSSINAPVHIDAPQQQHPVAAEGGSPHNKYLGNGSCHPSSSSQEDCEIVGTQPAKELAPGETPIQRQENEDYIKAEPVSPVRRFFPPRISIESPDQARIEPAPRQDGSVVTQARGSPGSNDPVVSRAARMLNRSTTIALSPTEKGDSENELALARPVQPSFTSYIIRQSSFDTSEDSGMSAGTPPNHSERARLQSQDSTTAPAAPVDPRMVGQNSPVYKPRQGLSGRLMTIHRQESIEEGRYEQPERRESVEEPPTTGSSSRPTAEVPPVTQAEVTRNRSHRLTFKEMANQMLESTEKRQLDPSTPLSLDLGNGHGAFPGVAALQRAGRPRSFSISEGDTRALYGGLNSEYPAIAAVRVPGAASERERPPYGSHIQPGWHPYPGLVYQSLSVDAGASKYWRYPNGGQRSLDPQEEVPSQPGSQGEDRPGAVEGGAMEGSVLYQALQSNEANGSSKGHRRRNSANVGNAQGTEGSRPSPPWQHPWTQRRGVSEMSQRMPWSHGSPPYPMLGQSQRESSVESLPSSGQKSSDSQQVFHHKRFRSMERSASEGHNSTANPHRKGGGQGISSESSQDLAQADDITRQVQQVMEGTNTLYTSRDKSAPIWTEEQHSPQSGQGDPNDRDSDLRRRSRKSTFNIYREIPERKRKLDRDEEEKIKHSYNPDGSFDYFTLTGWKAYKCDLCKKRRFKTASELEDHKRRKHGSIDAGSPSAGSPLPLPASGPSNGSSSSTTSVSNTTAAASSPSSVATTPPTTSTASLTTTAPSSVSLTALETSSFNRSMEEPKSAGSG